jgi:16S rRNA C967 or C1407 C5-methylase (RsmB/RsmF family)
MPSSKKNASSGSQRSEFKVSEFDQHFSVVYGDRWDCLRASLLAEEHKARRSCFGGYAEYVMDQASIAAASVLGVRPGDEVLDLCAAPGGKTLILAEHLKGSGMITANELSRDRRIRLLKVIEDHVPVDQRDRIKVTGFDGNQFGLKKPGEYDRVLLDAPCSSERHLLQVDSSMRDWKESRTRQLAMRQYSLICSALLSLKPGGVLVYSTCSISPLENDGVVERLLKKKEDQVVLDPLSEEEVSQLIVGLEKTSAGYRIFPDQAQGAGPIYFARLKKIRS